MLFNDFLNVNFFFTIVSCVRRIRFLMKKFLMVISLKENQMVSRAIWKSSQVELKNAEKYSILIFKLYSLRLHSKPCDVLNNTNSRLPHFLAKFDFQLYWLLYKNSSILKVGCIMLEAACIHTVFWIWRKLLYISYCFWLAY